MGFESLAVADVVDDEDEEVVRGGGAVAVARYRHEDGARVQRTLRRARVRSATRVLRPLWSQESSFRLRGCTPRGPGTTSYRESLYQQEARSGSRPLLARKNRLANQVSTITAWN